MKSPSIRSYIKHGDTCFCVSTIERESSAVFGRGKYNETLVWKHLSDNNSNVNILYQREGPAESIKIHNRICTALYETGSLPLDEEE